MSLTPYYQDDYATIYHADSLEFRPPAEAIITDPEYGSHPTTGGLALPPAALRSWLKLYRTVAVFGYPELLAKWCVAAQALPSEWVCWWPTNAGCKAFKNSGGLTRQSEHIAIFGEHYGAELRAPRSASSLRILQGDYKSMAPREKAKGLGNGLADTVRLGDVWTDSAPGLGFQSHKRQHPNEKPVPLLTRLVEMCSQPGDTVLDPYAGSGTSLVAAKSLGRKAIGIEIEEKYCEIAAKRLSQEVLPLEAS